MPGKIYRDIRLTAHQGAEDEMQMVLTFGGCTIGFSGLVPQFLEDSSFLGFVAAADALTDWVYIFHDPKLPVPSDAPLIWEDVHYRVYRKEQHIWALCSAHGELDSWEYAVLDFDMCSPEKRRLQILVPDSTFRLDSVMSGIMVESCVLRHNQGVLHASVVQWGNGVVLFSGPSGIGKSTQAELWQTYGGGVVLNGDKVLISCDDFSAMGLPYSGTSGICEKFHLPILAIVFLSQSAENRIEPMAVPEMVKSLFSQTAMQRWNDQDIDAGLDFATKLAQNIPVIRYSCRPDQDAVGCLQAYLEEHLK